MNFCCLKLLRSSNPRDPGADRSPDSAESTRYSAARRPPGPTRTRQGALHTPPNYGFNLLCLTPSSPRAMASTRGLAMAEPSAGRVAVDVMATLNHFTELTTGTTATGGMLGVDVRSCVAIVFMLEADAVAPRPSRHSA